MSLYLPQGLGVAGAVNSHIITQHTRLWSWREYARDYSRGCRTIKFIPPKAGHYLKNHVVSSLTIGTSFRECEHHCLMTSKCVSVNIGPTIDHKVICELSDSDDIQHPEDLIARPGWTYGVTENVCSILKPCQNNAKCLYGYTDKKYLCVCVSGFKGENCENDVDEGSSGLHNCSKNASCINTVGNFSCMCNPGFTGDGDMCSDCNSTSRRFEVYQDLPTIRSRAVEQFIIDESVFLVFADWKAESFIYKLNSLTGKFALHQTLPIRSALDFDHFMIADKHYLGVTLRDDDKVAIYEWNGTQFVNFQNVPFKKATTLFFLAILPERFLAVTSDNNVTSVYKWNDHDTQFEKFKDIASSEKAYGVTMFVIDNETFIAIANCWSSKYGLAVPSSVYKWSANSFVKIQSLQTYGAVDVKSFSISGDTFLAFANSHNGSSPFIDSFIYKWNGTKFTLFQSIPTRRAVKFSLHVFVMCGETYLGVANYRLKSIVYRFSGSQFIKYQEIASQGATHLKSFEYNGQTYIVVANNGGNSTVYKWV